MAFTEQDLRNQQQEIARLASELERLNSIFNEQKKTLGIEGDVTVSDAEMTPELEQAMAEARAEAEKAGRASAAHLQNSAPAVSAHTRRGAMRI